MRANAEEALDFALALHADMGYEQIHIRAGIHAGPLHVENDDAFGGTVNFAARVEAAAEKTEIWASDRAKQDIDQLGARRHKHLKWRQHEGIKMKGFSSRGTGFTLWSLA